MIKLKVSYETEIEKQRILQCLSMGNRIKKISKPVKSYANGKIINRFYVELE